MTYRVELAETAKADIRAQARYLRNVVSVISAEKWLVGLERTIATLQTQPLRCPLADESGKFARPIHEHYHGRRPKDRFRILFEKR